MIGKKLRLNDQLGEMVCETTNYIACGQPRGKYFYRTCSIVRVVSTEGRHRALKSFCNVHRNQLSRFRLQFEKAALGLLQK